MSPMSSDDARKRQIAPNYALIVGDTDIQADITDRIESVEVDFDIDKATEITLVCDDSDRAISGYKIFGEGNIVHVYMGYGSDLDYVATGEVIRWVPQFPRSSAPTVTIKAYDASHKHMDRQGHRGGSSIKNVRDSDVATHKIGTHMSFKTDVDQSDGTHTRWQKKGVSDYHFVKRLALINGFYYWVDYDPHNEVWVGHWRDKKKLRMEQEKMYSFIYNNNVAVSLLEFGIETTLRGQSTEVEVVGWNEKLKQPISAIVKEEESYELPHKPGRGAGERWEVEQKKTHPGLKRILKKKIPANIFTDMDPTETGIPKATAMVFTAFGQRLEVVSHKPFASKKAAQAWAERYMRARQENFVIGDGVIVGTPDLRPRQIHLLGGLGSKYDGQWEFTQVKHKMAKGHPYEIRFQARRLYDPTNPKPPPVYVPIVPRTLPKDYFDDLTESG